MTIHEITISEDLACKRIDQVLSIQLGQSRSAIQKMIDQRRVTVNNSAVKKRHITELYDVIQISSIEEKLKPTAKAQNIPIDILFEDHDILVINKPSGMVTHPANTCPDSTLVNAVAYHVKNLSQSDSLRPGIIHRLDKETSGVIVVAKNDRAHEELSRQFANREVTKTYLAICHGSPINQLVSVPIGRHPNKRTVMSTHSHKAKEALSEITTLSDYKPFFVAEIKPKTGRTHQIRVHIKHLGRFIMGDDTYGNSKVNHKHHVTRCFLHAHKLQIYHPVTKEPLIFTAPLPEDMTSFIEQNGLDFTLNN